MHAWKLKSTCVHSQKLQIHPGEITPPSRPSPAGRPCALSTLSLPLPAPCSGHTQQPLVPGASARARPWALLNVCAPGSPALVGKGEEWLRRALDRRAGGPRNREGSGGRGGSWPVEEVGGARRWLCAAAAKVAAAAAAVVAAAPAGAESWKREPRARPGSTRGAAAGPAALLAWAEPRDTGLAGPRQQQVGRV